MTAPDFYFFVLPGTFSIVPDGVHAKTRLGNADSGHTAKELLLPPVNLQPSLLVVRNGHPFISPRTRGHGVAVATTRWGWVEQDLALDGTRVAQRKGGDVARQVELVGARRGEQVATRAGQGAHVGTVLGPAVGFGNAGGNQRPVAVRVDGHVRVRVDEVLADAVALLHEGVQVVARGVDGDPARVVAGLRAVDGADEVDGRVVLGASLVDPELVGAEVGGVQVGLGGVEDHAVDARVGLVFVVLDVLFEGARVGIGGEDGAVAGVVVEGVAVDGVWGFLGGEEEDGAGVCGGKRGFL
jgi:hypothetical protein